MLQSRGFRPCARAPPHVTVAIVIEAASNSSPASATLMPPRVLSVLLVLIYFGCAIGAFASGNHRFGDAAVFTLFTLALVPGLVQRRARSWVAWLVGLAIGLLLIESGADRLALELIPVLVNAALCAAIRALVVGGAGSADRPCHRRP